VDNEGHVRNLCLPREAQLSAFFNPNLLGGVEVVRGEALSVSQGEDGKCVSNRVLFQAIPYYAWDNRQPGEMVLWLPEKPELAEIPGEDGVLVDGVRIRASHVNPTDTLTGLLKQGVPQSSNDHSIPRMTWWDHKGSSEWISYRFPKAREVSSVAVYWFDDTGRGACRVPAEWKLLWRDGKEWKPVQRTEGAHYGTALDQFNKVTFEPVKTHELKLEVKLKPGYSGGVLRWRVSPVK
jgi:hypothetical protein